MTVINDQVEDMIASLRKSNAQQVGYIFDIEKEGERFTFEISLKRKEEDFDE